MHGVIIAQSGGLASVSIDKQQLDSICDLTIGTKVTMFLHYEDITIALPSAQTAPSSARNHLIGQVVKTFPVGSQMRVTIDCGFPLVALITKRSWEDMGLAMGQTVAASFKASSLHVIAKH